MRPQASETSLAARGAARVVVITAEAPPAGQQLREAWKQREILYFFARRDIVARYKQTTLGVAWALVQPLLMMGVLTIFFGRLLKVPSDGVSFPLFAYSALLAWDYFSSCVRVSSGSIVNNGGILTNVPIQPVHLILTPVVTAWVDLSVASLVLVAIMLVEQQEVTIALVALPLFFAWLFGLTTGVSTWVGALNARYRDVQYIVPFCLQVMFFLTPIFYASSIIPESWKPLYALNPLAGIVQGIRWSVLGGPGLSTAHLGGLALSMVVLFSGLAYLSRVQRTFADTV